MLAIDFNTIINYHSEFKTAYTLNIKNVTYFYNPNPRLSLPQFSFFISYSIYKLNCPSWK